MNTEPLWNWVNERHAIYIRKSILGRPGGQVKPRSEAERGAWGDGGWNLNHLTNDDTLRHYRFCNAFRELDRVTTFIRQSIREPFADHPDLWLMLAIGRTINWPDTLQFLMNRGEVKCASPAWPTGLEVQGLPHLEFRPSALGLALDFWKMQGKKVYTGAYVIRAESNRAKDWFSWSKQRYIAEIVVGRLWERREEWREFLAQPGVGMQDVWTKFQEPHYIGWGPFMAYQVVVDMRWTRYLENAPDINKWAALGPGSRRGLNRLAGRDPKRMIGQDQGLEEMIGIHKEQAKFRAPWVPKMDLSDIQNALCETDKWLRVVQGEGRPRAHYVVGRGY